jgi:hypothetical protein
MSQKLDTSIAVIGIDIGKNSFHVVGHDRRGAIVLRQKWSRRQVEARLANMPRCLIGMKACVHDARLMPAKYVRPYSRGQKNDFRDAEAIAEAVQRRTMKFVATKTAEQLDLQALHRVRERLVSQRAGPYIGSIAPDQRSHRLRPLCFNSVRTSAPQGNDAAPGKPERREPRERLRGGAPPCQLPRNVGTTPNFV